jgi:hypothetical protein
MPMRTLRFVAITCRARGGVDADTCWAPGRAQLSGAQWLAIQHTYGGYAVVGGIAEL